MMRVINSMLIIDQIFFASLLNSGLILTGYITKLFTSTLLFFYFLAMPKVKSKKLHTGVKPIGGCVVKSRKMARKITSAFHKAMTCEAPLQDTSSAFDETKVRTKGESFQRNGVHRYQEASIVNTNHFKTSKWIVQALQRHNKLPDLRPGNLDERLNTLEVGAINDQLFRSPYLSVRAVDINAQLPCIEECDFFDIIPHRQYDVVVCSMVMFCKYYFLSLVLINLSRSSIVYLTQSNVVKCFCDFSAI